MPRPKHQKRVSRVECYAKPTTTTAAAAATTTRRTAKIDKPPTPPSEGGTEHDAKTTSLDSRALTQRPTFAELPLRPSDPKGSAWGLYGAADELGTLNLLTPSVVQAAAASEIQLGELLPLNLPLTSPLVPMNPRRKPCAHTIIAKGYANDDEMELNTQGSSHWDGLRHFPYQESEQVREDGPRYYNGATQADISGPNQNERIGIQNIARRGIAARGVLLDWRAWALAKGISYSPFASHAIPLAELQAVALAQGVVFRQGDILLVRSGWLEEYNRMSDEDKTALAQRPERTFVGVEGSREMMEWHWDNGFAAVAGDTNAYEAWPPKKAWGVSCHEVFLSGWGMPIGELWDLEGLAKRCRELGRWSFFLTSCPLNLPAGVASPPNAMAIF
ncbi:hypothetical protein SPI_06506 [Niveomyces insectorum RCEF 264]|uniref:Cyclase n=1 Tax=Niveomyces insectorum RCEF 264 TaxID=1081102 RepID=A0A167RB57_9HYPO|nr:hypothetical protein SPI_06506 [Niveomyces insectorum RCEF 264]